MLRASGVFVFVCLFSTICYAVVIPGECENESLVLDAADIIETPICLQHIIRIFFFIIHHTDMKQMEANPDAKRLYDDLLSNYNRLIRPVVNNTETLTVWLGLKITQLIEVNLKNQVMTTNLWVPQVKSIYAHQMK